MLASKILPALIAACLLVPLSAQQIPLDVDLESSALEELTFQIWADKEEHSFDIQECPGLNAQCSAITSNGASVHMTYSLDATSLRGKRIRFAASLLVDYPAISRAQLFMRVDRTAGVGFHEYTPSSRNDSRDWTAREIIGTVDSDAKRITIGVRFSGRGTAFFAEPKLETVAD
jgi:hypothetical protein